MSADADLTHGPVGAVGRRLARYLTGTTGVHVVGITAEPIIADASPVGDQVWKITQFLFSLTF